VNVRIGLDLGQRREPSALCVVQIQERRGPNDRRTDHFLVRHLERLPVGSTFPEVARRTAEVADEVRRRAEDQPYLYVDATGLGDPVVNLLRDEAPGVWVRPVYFTHGDRRSSEGGEIRLGKAWLVARLQTLLQTGELHLPRTAEAETLARDLLDFEIEVREDANERYGAFRVGRHDDLVTALGLAVQEGPWRWELVTLEM
jgi:hypothetical protein